MKGFCFAQLLREVTNSRSCSWDILIVFVGSLIQLRNTPLFSDNAFNSFILTPSSWYCLLLWIYSGANWSTILKKQNFYRFFHSFQWSQLCTSDSVCDIKGGIIQRILTFKMLKTPFYCAFPVQWFYGLKKVSHKSVWRSFFVVSIVSVSMPTLAITW